MARTVWIATGVALAIRLIALIALNDPLTVSWSGLENWGYEQGHIGRSLAETSEFADPFGRETGPTGWVAPLYPALFALLAKVCGGVTMTMVWSLAVLQVIASALVCVAIAFLARGLGRRDLEGVAAWAWALYPQGTWFAVTLVWDSTLVVLFLALWLGCLANAGREPDSKRVFRLGLGLGALALLNPAPLALVPALFGWLRFDVKRFAILGAGALLVAGPWMVRNAVVVGSPGIRTNFGAELHVGNNDDAEGAWVSSRHPGYGAEEVARYDELGEHAFVKDAGDRAKAWIGDHPGRYVELCAIRWGRFWFDELSPEKGRNAASWVEWISHVLTGALALLSLLLWRGREGSGWIVRGTVLLFPVVYVLTHVMARHRFPIDAIVVLLAVGVVFDRLNRSRSD